MEEVQAPTLYPSPVHGMRGRQVEAVKWWPGGVGGTGGEREKSGGNTAAWRGKRNGVLSGEFGGKQSKAAVIWRRNSGVLQITRNGDSIRLRM